MSALAGVEASRNSAAPASAFRGAAAVFAASLTLFALVALLFGLPGPDGNAAETYDGISRLSHTFTYAISRTPGQPFLDYCNFVFWSLGGDLAVQTWFVLASASGVTALYLLLTDLRAASPLAGACALALQPMFLGHVGGVGDFAASLSFLLVALWAAARGWEVAAGIALAMAVGCRLNLCVYLVSVALLLWQARRRSGDSPRIAFLRICRAGALAGGLSLLQFAPLFAFYGKALLQNFAWQTWKYHISATAYRLFVGYGAPFWALAAALAVWLVAKRSRALAGRRTVGAAAVWLMLAGLVTLFRVPGKSEYALPFLAGAILFFQAYAPKSWNYALLLSSVLAGLVVASPYDNQQDVYGWKLGEGWYGRLTQQARDNRLQMATLRKFLQNAPPRTVLVARCSWTRDQAQAGGLQAIANYRGIGGLTAYTFAGLGEDRVAVHFQEPKLIELLSGERGSATEPPVSVVFDRNLLGLLRRWAHFDPERYGQTVALPSHPFAELWSHAGESNARTAGNSDGR
ncbi:MAG TPA: hypothetical protein VMU19_13270 [Bryobacteraceae bacterium]|nr:hypothetical protein [Bryobacteraceae bacterium]